MNTVTVVTGEIAKEQDAVLPEKLGGGGLALIASDVATTFVLMLLAAVFHHVRSALLALTPVVVLAWSSGRYRVSFATVPSDELYATFAFAVPAIVLAAVLVPIVSTSWFWTLGTAAVWTIAAAATAIVLCGRRRGGSPHYVGVCTRLDHIARARIRSHATNGAIAAMDFAIALAASIVLSPLMFVCAAAIVQDSGFPVFFRQKRVGLDDREFVMFKFRTMREGSGVEWATPGDARVTRIGRFLRRTSLDELPQLWNVLKGEMSLVGPRPEMCEYARRFTIEIADYSDRHLVPPGITGWAQLHYPRNFVPALAREALARDLFYVCNRSMTLYAFCLVKTFCEVLSHRAV
jgi:lipopolysaccharide/colanic/teichoic acid biosynthesis glycosyltransferase